MFCHVVDEIQSSFDWFLKHSGKQGLRLAQRLVINSTMQLQRPHIPKINHNLAGFSFSRANLSKMLKVRTGTIKQCVKRVRCCEPWPLVYTSRNTRPNSIDKAIPAFVDAT